MINSVVVEQISTIKIKMLIVYLLVAPQKLF